MSIQLHSRRGSLKDVLVHLSTHKKTETKYQKQKLKHNRTHHFGAMYLRLFQVKYLILNPSVNMPPSYEPLLMKLCRTFTYQEYRRQEKQAAIGVIPIIRPDTAGDPPSAAAYWS